MLPYLLAKLQYSTYELNVEKLSDINDNSILKFKDNEYPSLNLNNNNKESENLDESEEFLNDIILYKTFLYVDPNNTVRKKAARLLEKYSEAFPQTIYSSVIELLEDDYLAKEWFKK